MPTRTKRSVLTAVLAASTLLLSGLAAAPQAGAATLYACVKKKGGTARFVNARTNCRRGETKLSWNTQGLPGRNGSNGKNGAAGKNGTNGKNGADGKAGANGKDGANGASTGVVDFSDSPFDLPLTRTAIATLPSVRQAATSCSPRRSSKTRNRRSAPPSIAFWPATKRSPISSPKAPRRSRCWASASAHSQRASRSNATTPARPE
jgi:hypothetical protein